jgi:hypothetical protein
VTFILDLHNAKLALVIEFSWARIHDSTYLILTILPADERSARLLPTEEQIQLS